MGRKGLRPLPVEAVAQGRAPLPIASRTTLKPLPLLCASVLNLSPISNLSAFSAALREIKQTCLGELSRSLPA